MPKKPVPPLDDRAKAAYTALYESLKAEMPPEEFRAFTAKLQAQVVFNRDFSKYKDKPAQYAKDVLKVKLLPKQIEIAEAVLKYPRVMVRSCNGYSKSHTAGSLINFWFDCRVPSITLTTAPTESSVIDILWKEVRTQRRGRPGLSPKAPRMELAPNHYAQGYTAKDAASFQGRRERDLLIIMDEAVGVPEEFWTAAKAMMTSPEHRWLVLYNPLDSSSFVYTEETNVDSNWHVITLNALEHPNVALELAGQPPLVEAGVRLSWVNQAFKDWTTKVESKDDIKPIYDVEWPPQSGVWYRPGPEFEARVLGRWPTGSVYSIWNDAVITACETKAQELPKDTPPEIGCDVAHYGCFDDQTEILTNKGWKFFESLQGDEKVLTLNENTAEWGNITKLHKYPFDGYLNLYETEKCNFCVTDNHRLIVRESPKSDKYKIDEFDRLAQEFVIKRTNDWKGSELSPIVFNSITEMPNGGERVYTWEFSVLDWAEFLGWYVSEGCTFQEKRENGRYRICIAQKDGTKKKVKIENLLNRMGLAFGYTNHVFSISNNEIGKHLLEHCGRGAANKRIPNYIKEAPTDVIEKFLSSFTDGDGHTCVSGTKLLFTSSVKLADDLQEVLVKLGKAGKLNVAQVKGSEFEIEGRKSYRKNTVYYVTYKLKSADRWVNKKDIQKHKYDGFVYCVSTPLETILVRRKGCVMWSGNSNDTVLYVRWGKSIVHRESRQGVEYAWTANRAKQLADEWGKKSGMDGKKVAIKLDAGGGYGEAVFELREGYNFILINGASTAIRENNYHNRRSELWFQTFRMAEDGLIEWSRLTPEEKKKLRRQLLSAKYSFDLKNRLQVEEKKKTMKEAGGSPDEADALNLACTNFFRPPPVKKKNAVEPFKDRYKDKGFLDQSRAKDWMMP